jgi:hydrogenase maturation protein HypF
MPEAMRVKVKGVVQGVGFRPFVYRLAKTHCLTGWVLNQEEGVEIHIEGNPEDLTAFLKGLQELTPPAARVNSVASCPAELQQLPGFSIADSTRTKTPSTRISPDLPVCRDCLRELFSSADRRSHYPYINCTNCGPRYSIILGLPYDRPWTTMKDWPMCAECETEYLDPANRRFHAQPVACPHCGPQYQLFSPAHAALHGDPMEQAADRLRRGEILAIKGLGGYHLACDAYNAESVLQLRERKFRKEKPFALMVRDLDAARNLVDLSPDAEDLVTSTARPIVLARARTQLEGVAPDSADLGVMLPYAPIHHLLFAGGAPAVLVMTSANRSNEPIAYQDEDAFGRLTGIADGFLVGQRPIARRVDDSVVRPGAFGPQVLRRSRGYAPGAAARLPSRRPILALGADLKNTVTLAVEGQAFVSQHLGDLDQLEVFEAFRETIADLLKMYELSEDQCLIVHDLHPEYASTLFGLGLPGSKLAVQHHRAHIASVLAEREAWDKTVIGFAFDGTGYGDDGAIWGGEVFAGSLAEGLARVAHLRPALLPGGDAATRAPVQAAAGFLAGLEDLPDLEAPPFSFPERYRLACRLVERHLRCFTTTSMGRLFDTVAALCGFTREITYEGQAAIWLEHQAQAAPRLSDTYPFDGFDFRPLLKAIIGDRLTNRPVVEIAATFHRTVARTIVETGSSLGTQYGTDAMVLSGGVFQNALLLKEIQKLVENDPPMTVWVNRVVPPNDGGISLGQAACVSLGKYGI